MSSVFSMYGKMQEFGLNEIIPLTCTSAIWGQYPVLSQPEWCPIGGSCSGRGPANRCVSTPCPLRAHCWGRLQQPCTLCVLIRPATISHPQGAPSVQLVEVRDAAQHLTPQRSAPGRGLSDSKHRVLLRNPDSFLPDVLRSACLIFYKTFIND